MPDYLLFDRNRKGYDDGNGNNVSLGKHLEYVYSEGGSLDNDDDICDVSFQEMKRKVSKMEGSFYVVEKESLRTVWKTPDRDNELTP